MAHIVNTVCRSHCGGACPLKAHVENGVVRRLETDPEYRACVRGRAYRQRLYAPDRVLYPLKRTGPRGSGEFKRISWDEALDSVASQLKRVKAQYGPEAIACIGSGGDVVHLHNAGLVEALLARFGGFSGTWGSHSAEGAWFASMVTYGTVATGNSRDDLINSRLIILWGWNPAVTIALGDTAWQLNRAREAGARIVAIDPRCNSTAAALAGQWLPIRPGTDTAMLVAMAWVIISEKLEDRDFLGRCTVGFDRFHDYVMGKTDNVPKDPRWAEKITGVPAETISALARDYALTKPAALMDGLAVGRTARGEQFHRAAITLGAMTGNIGLSGGCSGGYSTMGGVMPLVNLGMRVDWRMKGNVNQVDTRSKPRPFSEFNSSGPASAARVNRFELVDAILEGKKGGYPADIRALYIITSNYLNQCADTNRIARALESLEFVVTHEQFLNATARYADVVFPATTLMERNDVCTGGISPWYGFLNQAAEPQGEAKSHFEICCLLAERLGIEGFGEKTEEEWLREIVGEARDLPGYDQFRREGIHKLKPWQPYIDMKSCVADPVKNPFRTKSGKIEIYSQKLADYGDPRLPPVPQYLETWENLHDPLAREYPLQLITTHTTRRAHSTFETLPWLRELYPQSVLLNPADASARGIHDGDLVRIYNGRGATVVQAKLSERIMPGVVDLPEGAWYRPGPDGVDRGGCSNVLTRSTVSPSGAFPSNTALVQVEKAGP